MLCHLYNSACEYYIAGHAHGQYPTAIFEKIFEFESYKATNESQGELFCLQTLIGLTLTKASSELASSGLQYLVQGDGDYVTGQIPAPGTEVKKGDIVLLIFE